MSAPATIAVSIASNGQVVTKRVRRSMLPIYEKAGWHVVPRRRFKHAKRAHERKLGYTLSNIPD